jgi:hypothetical protein
MLTTVVSTTASKLWPELHYPELGTVPNLENASDVIMHLVRLYDVSSKGYEMSTDTLHSLQFQFSRKPVVNLIVCNACLSERSHSGLHRLHKCSTVSEILDELQWENHLKWGSRQILCSRRCLKSCRYI